MTTWFLCPLVDPGKADDLRALGITLANPQDRAVYYRNDEGVLMKEIGAIAVYDWGPIHAWPYEDSTRKDVARLLGAAEKTFRSNEKLCKAQGGSGCGTRERPTGTPSSRSASMTVTRLRWPSGLRPTSSGLSTCRASRA